LKDRLKTILEDLIMALKNLFGQNNVEKQPTAACGSACGAGFDAAGDKKTDEKPTEKPTACSSACGAGDKK
jgi:ACGX-repeat protein